MESKHYTEVKEILFWAEVKRVGLQDRGFQLLEYYPYIHSNLQLTLSKKTTHLYCREDLLLVFPSSIFWEGKDMILYSPLGHSKLSKALYSYDTSSGLSR
jgi:hypothetical protein